MNEHYPCRCGHRLKNHNSTGGKTLCSSCVIGCTKKEGECKCYHEFKLDNLRYLEFEAKRAR